MNSLEPLGKKFMYTIFHRIQVSKIRDPDIGIALAYTLNTPLALFEAGWIPGQVDVDEASQALKVQAFRSGVGSEKNLYRAFGYHGFYLLTVGAAAAAILPDKGAS